MHNETALLTLGRLDGRLSHSTAAQLWLIKARLEGAAIAASNAGVPVTMHDLQSWLCGIRNPPRAQEGLNDPLSVAAVIYFFFGTLDHTHSESDAAVTRLMRSLLDIDREANMWGQDDLIRFGPLWRALLDLTMMAEPASSISAVAKRLYEMARIAAKSQGRRQLLATSFDGKQLRFVREDRQAWLISLMVPELLRRAGLTINLIPILVPTLKFLDCDAKAYEQLLFNCISKAAQSGLKSLETLERQMGTTKQKYQRTARSRLLSTAELRLVLPSLTRRKLAIALGSTPAGAAYLMRQLAECG
jgi:hypothetical protein